MPGESIESIIETDPTTYHFFEKEKDWVCYSCYAQQASSIAQKFYKTTSVLKKENGVDSLNISKILMSRIAKALLDENISIQWWRKQSDMWFKSKYASPGYSKELDFLSGVIDMESSAAAIHIWKRGSYHIIGIAIANTSLNRLFLTEVFDETNLLRSYDLKFNSLKILICAEIVIDAY